jgi:hypothetical protein
VGPSRLSAALRGRQQAHQSARRERAADALQLRCRETLNDVIQLIVRDRRTMVEALAVSELGEETAPGFGALLEGELRKLDVHNCARYRLTLRATEAWVRRLFHFEMFLVALLCLKIVPICFFS